MDQHVKPIKYNIDITFLIENNTIFNAHKLNSKINLYWSHFSHFKFE